MAQIIVRNLEDVVKRKLKRRAAHHGHSMEQEIRDILRDAVKDEDRAERGLGSAIAARFKGIALEAPIPQLKIKIKPPKFK
jgi:antitoxin FitA